MACLKYLILLIWLMGSLANDLWPSIRGPGDIVDTYGEYPWVSIAYLNISKDKISFPCNHSFLQPSKIPQIPGAKICEYRSQFSRNVYVRIYNNSIGFIVYSWRRLCIPLNLGASINTYPFKDIIKLYNITNTTHFFVVFPNSLGEIFVHTPGIDTMQFEGLKLGVYPPFDSPFKWKELFQHNKWGVISGVMKESEFKKLVENYNKSVNEKNYNITALRFYLIPTSYRPRSTIPSNFSFWVTGPICTWSSDITEYPNVSVCTVFQRFLKRDTPVFCRWGDIPEIDKFVIKNELIFLAKKGVINLKKNDIEKIIEISKIYRHTCKDKKMDPPKWVSCEFSPHCCDRPLDKDVGFIEELSELMRNMIEKFKNIFKIQKFIIQLIIIIGCLYLFYKKYKSVE